MKKSVELITVERANELLSNNIKNRPISEKMILEMSDDILNDKFDKDQANVCLNEDGTLFYGQHILSTIVKLNKPLELNVYTKEKGERHFKGMLNFDSKYKYKLNRFIPRTK